jgi:hypothetical protein
MFDPSQTTDMIHAPGACVGAGSRPVELLVEVRTLLRDTTDLAVE